MRAGIQHEGGRARCVAGVPTHGGGNDQSPRVGGPARCRESIDKLLRHLDGDTGKFSTSNLAFLQRALGSLQSPHPIHVWASLPVFVSLPTSFLHLFFTTKQYLTRKKRFLSFSRSDLHISTRRTRTCEPTKEKNAHTHTCTRKQTGKKKAKTRAKQQKQSECCLFNKRHRVHGYGSLYNNETKISYFFVVFYYSRTDLTLNFCVDGPQRGHEDIVI